jgi:hypothetical protein
MKDMDNRALNLYDVNVLLGCKGLPELDTANYPLYVEQGQTESVSEEGVTDWVTIWVDYIPYECLKDTHPELVDYLVSKVEVVKMDPDDVEDLLM